MFLLITAAIFGLTVRKIEPKVRFYSIAKNFRVSTFKIGLKSVSELKIGSQTIFDKKFRSD